MEFSQGALDTFWYGNRRAQGGAPANQLPRPGSAAARDAAAFRSYRHHGGAGDMDMCDMPLVDMGQCPEQERQPHLMGYPPVRVDVADLERRTHEALAEVPRDVLLLAAQTGGVMPVLDVAAVVPTAVVETAVLTTTTCAREDPRVCEHTIAMSIAVAAVSTTTTTTTTTSNESDWLEGVPMHGDCALVDADLKRVAKKIRNGNVHDVRTLAQMRRKLYSSKWKLLVTGATDGDCRAGERAYLNQPILVEHNGYCKTDCCLFAKRMLQRGDRVGDVRGYVIDASLMDKLRNCCTEPYKHSNKRHHKTPPQHASRVCFPSLMRYVFYDCQRQLYVDADPYLFAGAGSGEQEQHCYQLPRLLSLADEDADLASAICVLPRDARTRANVAVQFVADCGSETYHVRLIACAADGISVGKGLYIDAKYRPHHHRAHK